MLQLCKQYDSFFYLRCHVCRVYLMIIGEVTENAAKALNHHWELHRSKTKNCVSNQSMLAVAC